MPSVSRRAALVAGFAAGVLGGSSFAAAADEKFIVHEWGVMITGGAAAGEVVELSPPAELYSGLPAFVLRHDLAYTPRRQNHGWDKPILHFYGPEALRVTVQIGVPMGKPLAYWPPPKFTERMGRQIASRKEQMIYSISEVTALNWTGTLSANPPKPPARVDPAHWWSQIRDVEGAKWINTDIHSERFIFYEATAKQQPAIRANLSADALTLRNTSVINSGKIVVLVNDGVSRWMAAVDGIAAGHSLAIDKAKLIAQPAGEDQVLAACKEQWRSMGMTESESAAIVQTWKPDLLNRVGFLVCARMPDVTYGLMFPLKVTPQPDELVRVGMVIDVLPGQADRLGWLPGLQQTLVQWSDELTARDFRKRESASRRFEQLGDLAKPHLERLKKSPNPEVSRAAAVLLQRLAEPTTKPAD